MSFDQAQFSARNLLQGHTLALLLLWSFGLLILLSLHVVFKGAVVI